jgi:glycosyltransferase involved in cell wall biosynthesis
MGLPPIVLFPSSAGMGGLEAHVVQLGRGLVERGLTVAAVCLPRDDLEPLRASLAEAGIQVHVLESRRARLHGPVRRLSGVTKILQKYKGCIVHLHYGGYGGGELIQAAAAIARARAVVRTEHVPPVPPFTLHGRVLLKIRDRFLARIICVAESNRVEHIRLLHRPADKFVVIPNGIDLTRYIPAEADPEAVRELGFEPDAPLVGTVARLAERRKRIDLFLDMAQRVLQSRPDVRFVVVGEGGLRSELERDAQGWGIADKVRFTGERSDVQRLLAAMRVFVMPSDYEAGPLTVLEALAMERPVVATPVGIVPDVIESRKVGGYLVPVGHADALAEATLEALRDKPSADRLARAGRPRVLTQFSIDAMVECTIDVYRDVYGWNETSTQ